MGFLKFFKPKKEENFLILDFGDKAVKGLIFSKEGRKSIIKKFSSQNIEKFGVFEAKNFEQDIIKKAAGRVIENLGIKNKLSQFPTIIRYHSSVLKARVFEISLKRVGEAEKIKEGEQKKIYENIFKEGKKKLLKEVRKKEKIVPSGIQILKEKILSQKISGYEVQSLKGLTGKNLDFKILIIFGLKNQLKFAQLLTTSLGLGSHRIFHEIEGLINFQKLRNNPPKIFLDIGAQTTQFFSFKKGLSFTDEFQVGNYDFSKALSKNLRMPEAEAEDLKQRFSENQLTPGVKKKIEKILLPVLNLWLNCFQKKLILRGFHSFSPKISLFGDGAFLPGIKKGIEGNAEYLLPDGLPLKNKTNISLSTKDIPILLLTLVHYDKKNY